MTATADITDQDPRPAYRSAQDWVLQLLDGVRPDQYELPTPCDEFDVRALCAHLVGTVDRARAVGADGTFETTSAAGPDEAPDGWVVAFGDAAARQRAVWDDDALLDRTVTVPWGVVPARDALVGYVRELVVHGWDLAVATGQPSEADPAIVTPLLERMAEFLPAGIRTEAHLPFAEPVEPPTGAGPTERLANWFGHARPAPA